MRTTDFLSSPSSFTQVVAGSKAPANSREGGSQEPGGERGGEQPRMPAAAPLAPSRKGGHKPHSSSAGAAAGGGFGGDVPTLVLDNGADRLKMGFAGDPAPRFLMPNCTAKLKGQLQWLVGDDIDLVNNTANLQYTRPFDRGYLTNWEAEHQVWKRAFGETKLKIEPDETRLVVTEAPFTPSSLSTFSTQVIFEEFGFAACAKLPAAILSAYHYTSTQPPQQRQQQQQQQQILGGSKINCALVIDSGFSFTHVVPLYQNKAQRAGIRRVNVGGKLLTNFLKETVSYRQWNMMDEFQLMNDAKEALCYVSQDFVAEMAKLRPGGGPNRRLRVHEGIRRNFVLPDFHNTMKGYVQDVQEQQRQQQQQQQQQQQEPEQQVLSMEVERFVVPEVLFRPSDVGLRQGGLPEAVVEAVEACDIGLRASLYSNIVLTGGNALFPGLAQRLETELRALVPEYHPVSVHVPPDPIGYAWRGGGRLAQDQPAMFVTKAQYNEYGAEACQERVFDAQW